MSDPQNASTHPQQKSKSQKSSFLKARSSLFAMPVGGVNQPASYNNNSSSAVAAATSSSSAQQQQQQPSTQLNELHSDTASSLIAQRTASLRNTASQIKAVSHGLLDSIGDMGALDDANRNMNLNTSQSHDTRKKIKQHTRVKWREFAIWIGVWVVIWWFLWYMVKWVWRWMMGAVMGG